MLIDAGWLCHGSITPQKAESDLHATAEPPLINA